MTVLDTVLEVLAAAALLTGAFLTFAAGMGVVRFPDLLARTHAATKPQVLGLILLLLGLSLRLREAGPVWVLLLVLLLQLFTSPVAAHMVSRAGYRTGKVRHDLLVVDELTADIAAAHREEEHGRRADRQGTDRARRASGDGPGGGDDHRTPEGPAADRDGTR